ncbi:LicD family, putative [Trypanosoma equiperdum]|uniref:LicD/FKTN/FKRP nucleotidyltransferase domain-containing protein n=3 Tax=Trypanozoon TaxID=39700 RepID=Q580E7_TRYB2|nr:hypothetical protein, conserved [Trypanosoma brucei gambiense DAL972]XP_844269.1 hypothetical protein, conserved [Trypanosoma brucei brucei TREU927]AAX80905.1 hypothetical protein, conserved [Trypanosoma brucei]SCU72425.1 LicD family, putative [Trypanosoma equiperdum]AAZ10710.1 hypothetical protein, conserved [Trypanosoma brucei brucei TREU927]CBH10397.1 hypothetical protein, conserved [Trypanosoma brucei gambiense DAL972]|eukprot:XP_011772687.1 hypothetical protein, conserved [Trypanosoma brucei gambiense DAL972]
MVDVHRKEGGGIGVSWVRAIVFVLLVYVISVTVDFCYNVYYDREAAFQNVLNCSLQVFRSNSVDCWLQNGTLLGSARLGRLLLWDADLDIGFVQANHTEKLQLLMNELDSKCFGARSDRRRGVRNPLLVFRKCTERICAEFHETSISNGIVTTGDGASPQRELFPLRTCTIGDVVAQCPYNSSYYLREAYGSGWLTASLLEFF